MTGKRGKNTNELSINATELLTHPAYFSTGSYQVNQGNLSHSQKEGQGMNIERTSRTDEQSTKNGTSIIITNLMLALPQKQRGNTRKALVVPQAVPQT